MVPVRLIGPGLFLLLAFVAALAIIAIVRSATTPQVRASHTRPQARMPGTGSGRPCAVYEIDTRPHRRYIGKGFNPHQRIMQTHRKADWWPRAVTAGQTFEPDRVDWYPSEAAAEAEEQRRIRAAVPGTLENKILYKSRTRKGAAQRP